MAYARDKNTSARLCAKRAEGAYAGGRTLLSVYKVAAKLKFTFCFCCMVILQYEPFSQNFYYGSIVRNASMVSRRNTYTFITAASYVKHSSSCDIF